MSRPYFSKYIFPKSNRSKSAKSEFGGYYSDAGTDVVLDRRSYSSGPQSPAPVPTSRVFGPPLEQRMQVRFFKVQNVAAAEGKMSLKVWHRLSWVDHRLAWEPDEFGGVTETYYMATNTIGEDTEIARRTTAVQPTLAAMCGTHGTSGLLSAERGVLVTRGCCLFRPSTTPPHPCTLRP
jgi:hypothetical protein